MPAGALRIQPGTNYTGAAVRLLQGAKRATDEGDLDRAERLYNEMLKQSREVGEALLGLGRIHLRRGRFDTALILFRASLAADPNRPAPYAATGTALQAMRRFAEALAVYEQGLQIAPDNAELRNGRGVVLMELRRFESALDEFACALACDPACLDALGNMGNVLLKLNCPEKALTYYDRVLERVPDNAPLLTNRAIALRRLDRPQEAILSAAAARSVRPDFAPALFVESIARLTLGDFDNGWRGYEARWMVGELMRQRRTFAAPLWLGREPLVGKTILLHSEQGFGDTIQFVRFAALVSACGAEVVLEVQPELFRLLAPAVPYATVVKRGDPLPPFDCHCPLLSLPLAFSIRLDTIPTGIPFIAAATPDAGRWRSRLPENGPLIGVVWAGEPSHENDRNRSLALKVLTPLFHCADLRFVSLQHELRDGDAAQLRKYGNVLQLGHEFGDFADTAAVMVHLDAVVAVDTAVAHLAGAMAKPLFLLLPFGADFRWLRGRTDSPWYPTARLFRQPRFGDWGTAVANVVQELIAWKQERLRPPAGELPEAASTRDLHLNQAAQTPGS